MKKVIVLILAFVLVLGLCACGTKTEPAAQTPTEPQPDPILQERREKAVAYMRDMATVLWRATEDLDWTTDSKILTDEDLAEHNGEPMKIRAGRLYQGVPYSFSGSSAHSFYLYLNDKEGSDYPELTGLDWKLLNGGSAGTGRIGNDCSASIQQAWDYIGADFTPVSTKYMTKDYGYLPVGEYENNPAENIQTPEVCQNNGITVMLEAYAQLQPADAVVRRVSSSGHTMMITSVNMVYNSNGTIDPNQSSIKVLHQTSAYLRDEASYYDETLGEDVYKIYGIDDEYSFMTLFESGYLPITCDALIDPNASKETWIKDSETTYNFENILQGTFTTNGLIAHVNITITDEAGNVVTEQTSVAIRETKTQIRTFDLNQFTTETTDEVRGTLDLEGLQSGTYHCTHTMVDIHGVEHIMRDFDFTI